MRSVTTIFPGWCGRAVVALCLLSCATRGRPAPVQLELIGDTAAAVPGQRLLLGVRFTIEPGWHIYWHNPGDSGMATQIDLELPPGFEAGPVLWPLPRRFELPGGLVAFGYEDEVLLCREVQVPATLTGETVTLTATAQWFACKDACLIGRLTQALKLPVRTRPEAANAAIFGRWRQRLPMSSARPDAPAAIHVSSRWPADSRRAEAHIRLQWRKGAPTPVPGTIACYPGQNQSADVEGLAVLPTPVAEDAAAGSESLTDVSLTLLVTVRETPPVLRQQLLVVYEDVQGTRRGLDLAVTIRQNTDATEGDRQ
jgi:DsbC/DsbD-like thiol-disulfide interchange protein